MDPLKKETLNLPQPQTPLISGQAATARRLLAVSIVALPPATSAYLEQHTPRLIDGTWSMGKIGAVQRGSGMTDNVTDNVYP